MGLVRLSLMILGAVLIIGIAKGAIAILIPIFALLIPIIAIVAFSPIGRAIANSINGINVSPMVHHNSDAFNHLQDKYNKLESRFNEYEDEMNKMREALIFSDSKKISTTSVNSDTNKIQLNNQINLEKNL